MSRASEARERAKDSLDTAITTTGGPRPDEFLDRAIAYALLSIADSLIELTDWTEAIVRNLARP